MKNIIILQTTVSKRKDARKISKKLLEKKLIACAQIDGPIESMYRWKGAVEIDEEYRLSVKTTNDCIEAAIRTIERNHPYEVPEIIGNRLEYCAKEYGAWLEGEVKNG